MDTLLEDGVVGKEWDVDASEDEAASNERRSSGGNGARHPAMELLIKGLKSIAQGATSLQQAAKSQADRTVFKASVSVLRRVDVQELQTWALRAATAWQSQAAASTAAGTERMELYAEQFVKTLPFDDGTEDSAAPSSTMLLPPFDATAFAPFLEPVNKQELCRICILCELTALTYTLARVTPSLLRKRYGFHLVTTSLWDSDDDLEGHGHNISRTAVDEALIPPNQLGHEGHRGAGRSPQSSSHSAVGMVSGKASDSPEERGHADNDIEMTIDDEVFPVHWFACTERLDDGPANHEKSEDGSRQESADSRQQDSNDLPLRWRSSSVQAAAVKSQMRYIKNKGVVDDQRNHSGSKHILHFVVQGSDSLESWKTNLGFDPVPFAEPGSRASVHRGIYEAALVLYDVMLPYVESHLQKYGQDRSLVSLTGHSLGGSLAQLLALMFNLRGVLTPSQLLPVYTFGAPSALCGAEVLLGRVGTLNTSLFRHVMIHRDIVPRAFSCFYPESVASWLKSFSESFKDSTCLGCQSLLYAPVGNMLVLQPQINVAEEHELLPKGSGLYKLSPPGASLAQLAHLPSPEEKNGWRHKFPPGTWRAPMTVVGPAHMAAVPVPAADGWTNTSPGDQPTSTVGEDGGSPPADGGDVERPSAPSTQTGIGDDRKGGAFCEMHTMTDLKRAQLAFLNSPHPLNLLADPGAYGPEGSISRHHNPDNYARALHNVRRKMGRRRRRLRHRRGVLDTLVPPTHPDHWELYDALGDEQARLEQERAAVDRQRLLDSIVMRRVKPVGYDESSEQSFAGPLVLRRNRVEGPAKPPQFGRYTAWRICNSVRGRVPLRGEGEEHIDSELWLHGRGAGAAGA